jgi:hypothetical protein
MFRIGLNFYLNRVGKGCTGQLQAHFLVRFEMQVPPALKNAKLSQTGGKLSEYEGVIVKPHQAHLSSALASDVITNNCDFVTHF